MLIYTLFLVLLIIISLLLTGVILIQTGDGGISQAFGGGGAQASNTFGASTPSVMVKITTTLAALFAVITLGLNIYSFSNSNTVKKSSLISHAEKGIVPLQLNLPANANKTIPGAGATTTPIKTEAVDSSVK